MNLFFRKENKSKYDDLGQEASLAHTKARQFIEYTLNVGVHKFLDQKSYLEAGSKLVWASYRAMHIKASVLQSTPFELIVEGRPFEKPEPPALDILNRPNPLDSWSDLLYMWSFHIGLVGEAYWLKDRINLKGQPEHLYPLIPHHVRKVTDPSKGIKLFEYTVNGKVIPIDPSEMIYFRKPHPALPLEGMGDIEPSETIYNRHINRAIYDEKFIERGASPSGVLTLKDNDPDPDDFAKLKAKWRKEYEGKQNIGKTAIISGNWEYHKLGLTHQEMENVESDRISISNIFMNHGIPLSIAGIEKATSLATARQDDINFRRYEIVPLITILVRKLNTKDVLFQLYNKGLLRLRYELSGLINVEQRVKDYGLLVTMGAMTLNELREKCGLEKVDNPLLDQYFVNNNRIPVDMAGLLETSGLPNDNGKPDSEPEEG